MKKIIVFGTFDIFHEGHRDFLRQAKEQGDFLRAVVARDATVVEVKGAPPQNDEQIRLATLKNSSLVDEAILGSFDDKYEAIKKYVPDVICLGYDQKYFIENLRCKLDELGLQNTKIIKLKPYHPEEYKSSKLRNH